MVDIFSSSAKLCIYIPKFYRRFENYILHIAGSYFSGCLVFYVYEVTVMLNLDNSVTWSPLEVPLARLLVFEIYPVTNLEGGWLSVHGLLSSFEAIFIQCLLCNNQGKPVSFKVDHSRVWISQNLLHGLQKLVKR